MELSAAKNEAHADYMAKYMKNQFDFLGLRVPIRKSICAKYFKKITDKDIDYEFVDICYRSAYREFQYIAVNYLQAVWKKLKSEDLKLIQKLIVNKSWWTPLTAWIK